MFGDVVLKNKGLHDARLFCHGVGRRALHFVKQYTIALNIKNNSFSPSVSVLLVS